MQIFPSLISADFFQLASLIAQLEPLCAGFHIDCMDNHFVDNLTWGAEFINALDTITKKPLWIHLMVDDPTSIIKRLTIKPHSIISVHIELSLPYKKIIAEIKNNQWQPSLAINPTTPLITLEPYLQSINHILLMSVEPGFSGQQFIEKSYERLEEIQHYKKSNPNLLIAMDGGIRAKILKKLITIGCDQVAVGSAIFNAKNPQEYVTKLSLL